MITRLPTSRTFHRPEYDIFDIFINCNLGCHPVAVHTYTQTIHGTTQITTNVEESWPCSVFTSFTLAFALQLRKKHGKTSVRLRKASVRVQYTYYQNTHTLHIADLTASPGNTLKITIISDGLQYGCRFDSKVKVAQI
jgi:hypothetical protein